MTTHRAVKGARLHEAPIAR